ncbi:DUF2927 domain-containing protein [Lentibacter algarum]|uniref:DUF2927 domain-containing protein n=1 Tax=Lentibacter algarum TaxID=576131 RepID=UPI001C0762A5|nr:DUF2927 domain-containing protein [Lentibacter algarum]MBU2980978.1 DUF2927 domain-containing protein [Lentibacter algarum]
MTDLLRPDDIETLFTRAEGNFLFARWGRPIAPIVFGVDDATVSVVKGALEAMSVLTQHPLAETDAELGSNLMVFFFREWDELLEVSDLDKLVPDLNELVGRLKAQDAQQYRFFRFDEAGAIKAAFSFIRVTKVLAEMPAESLALSEVVQTSLLWSQSAFATRSPLARLPNGAHVLRPDIAAVLKAAYDKTLPDIDQDKSFALRLCARASIVLADNT